MIVGYRLFVYKQTIRIIINFWRMDDLMLVLQCSVFAILLIIYIVNNEKLSEQIDCLGCYVFLIVFINKFLEIWGRIWSNISIFIGNQDIEANVIFFMPLSLSQFILFDILNDFFCSSQLCKLQNLIDIIVPN